MRLQLRAAEGRGIMGWSVRGLADARTSTVSTPASRMRRRPRARPIRTARVSIDHLVVITPDLDRTSAVLQGAGFDLRRLREGDTPGGSRRQAFFRMGELILEVVEAPADTKIAADPSGPARLWGISFGVADLAAPARRAGRHRWAAARRRPARSAHRDRGEGGRRSARRSRS